MGMAAVVEKERGTRQKCLCEIRLVQHGRLCLSRTGDEKGLVRNLAMKHHSHAWHTVRAEHLVVDL